jgi:hypothetical protein
VANDLTPSDTAHFDRSSVLGFVTEKGGVTSHTAILAEALGIPATSGETSSRRTSRAAGMANRMGSIYNCGGKDRNDSINDSARVVEIGANRSSCDPSVMRVLKLVLEAVAGQQ